jgi:hypothetical protein
VGRKTKGAVQAAPKGKEIVYESLPYPSTGKLGFRMEQARRPMGKDRLSELGDYRKIHGDCNVPHNYERNNKLARWIGTQRDDYRLYTKGKKSSMTALSIQELEILAFDYK